MSFNASTASSGSRDVHEGLHALYCAILHNQERFDEFKQHLSVYVVPPNVDMEPMEARSVRDQLNDRIREWIGPFEGLSVNQVQLWRHILIEQRSNIAIAPWKESNWY